MSIKSPSVRRALDDALRSAQIPAKGGAAVALAKRLASDIDATTDPDLLAKLTARYLPVLEALGLTMKPAAGAAKEGASGEPRSSLDEIRERRARLHSAPAGD
jgi:hypothetical protein